MKPAPFRLCKAQMAWIFRWKSSLWGSSPRLAASFFVFRVSRNRLRSDHGQEGSPSAALSPILQGRTHCTFTVNATPWPIMVHSLLCPAMSNSETCSRSPLGEGLTGPPVSPSMMHEWYLMAGGVVGDARAIRLHRAQALFLLSTVLYSQILRSM